MNTWIKVLGVILAITTIYLVANKVILGFYKDYTTDFKSKNQTEEIERRLREENEKIEKQRQQEIALEAEKVRLAEEQKKEEIRLAEEKKKEEEETKARMIALAIEQKEQQELAFANSLSISNVNDGFTIQFEKKVYSVYQLNIDNKKTYISFIHKSGVISFEYNKVIENKIKDANPKLIRYINTDRPVFITKVKPLPIVDDQENERIRLLEEENARLKNRRVQTVVIQQPVQPVEKPKKDRGTYVNGWKPYSHTQGNN